ncbi:hypothetical protein TIFTF001_037511 [Ficus carica]|uniref:Secreted protein n=1 Tax=Ficus carica TaxID=3494 RepID=A0AA88JC67_FICCA|nr:hypothetical protein TIFTF001_037506 [Ficus carica]GMN68453.1 hypothetical protein TIFTF001_037511 [Ficus carica]
MRTLLVISAALLLALACLQATDANPKYTQPVDPEGRKPSGRAAAVISGGGRRLLEANVVVSAPKKDEDPYEHRTFYSPQQVPKNSPSAH